LGHERDGDVPCWPDCRIVLVLRYYCQLRHHEIAELLGCPASEPGMTIPQPFGDPDQGRAIYIVSAQYDVVPDIAAQVTVRGRTGQAGPSWDVAENDVGHAISWEEQGARITALYKGTSRAEAIAVLDSLEWRSDDPADGFAPPSDPAWALRQRHRLQPQPGGRRPHRSRVRPWVMTVAPAPAASKP